MKFNLSDETKLKISTYSIILLVGISIYFAYYHIDAIASILSSVLGLTTPFLLGFALAFLLNKPMMFFENKVFKSWHKRPQLKRNVSAIIAMILAIIVTSIFLSLLLPQLIDSLFSLVKSFPGYVNEFQSFIEQVMRDNNIDVQIVNEYISQSSFLETLTEIVTKAIPQMAKITYQLGSTLLNILLGIMSALYMLMDKERLLSYVKKINYALFPEMLSQYMHRMVIASGEIFNNFIIGKAIDSLIIGILCYIGCMIFQFPYALLLAVFVGVTNMIPVFGPFIGAIPGVVILFIIQPMSALYFALFVFALQQFDGNVLGPLILGDKLGLPTIGILFSVFIGGGLFNILGMFLGVPCFAIIYMAIKEYVNYRLEVKQLDIAEQSKKAHIDAQRVETQMQHQKQ